MERLTGVQELLRPPVVNVASHGQYGPALIEDGSNAVLYILKAGEAI